ncbi:hypothetical protein [Mycolicibacterium mucogenicum]|uniref:hypothetical protein n=1 Tax=Mycolicibacterium mucogenicum TaxID=56689 RepID=UPI00226A0E79|nr:hypothetical protein [Mycolicibacterium mucogenicum]
MTPADVELPSQSDPRSWPSPAKLGYDTFTNRSEFARLIMSWPSPAKLGYDTVSLCLAF